MFSIKLVKLSAPIEKVLKFQRKDNEYFVIISSEYACSPRFVQYAFLQAFKACEVGKNTAKSLELEWLCKLALTPNVASALQFTKPDDNVVALASFNCFEKESDMREICEVQAVSAQLKKEGEKLLIAKYKISAKALENYAIEDLLIETAAVENV
ncbi:MAG: KEOPS complex subunit Cgi121 [Candidatus Micrarchaeota archaeon]